MSHTSRTVMAAMIHAQWQRALDMYGADAEHFGDCDQGGCNACILGDVHRIIYGVARPSTEG